MKRRAFTLIELMIVVAIIAVIAAILVPNFLRAREAARQRQRGNLPTVAAAKPVAAPAVVAPAPEIQSLTARLRLKNWTTRSGMDVTSRYRLEYDGQLQLQTLGPAELRIPFPRQTEEAMNVSLRFVSGEREWEPRDWSVTRWGLVACLPPGQPLQVKVKFEAVGRDQLWLELPPAQKLGHLSMQLVSEEQGLELAETSLQPQDKPAPGHWSWSFENLVSQSPLVVEMPGSHSLTGRVLLLCRLAGLAVLLFGLGFWYVGELYRPGCLARFGWGHFLMLALTYSSFFPALCVLTLGQGLSLGKGLAIAAALAQPLLLLHVWRSVDLRFSLFYVLPLADLTLAVVVNGVFGGPWRDAIFLAAGFVAVALVTLTYPRWLANRQRWRSHGRRELQTRLQALADQAQELARLAQEKPAFKPAQEALSQAESLASYQHNLEDGDYESVRTRADLLEAALSHARHGLLTARLLVPPVQCTHCTACGQPGCTGSFCSHCGQARALPLECRCSTKIWVTARPTGNFFCPCCGHQHSKST